MSITSDDVEQFSALVSPKEFDKEHAKIYRPCQKILHSFITETYKRLAVWLLFCCKVLQDNDISARLPVVTLHCIKLTCLGLEKENLDLIRS